MLTAELVTVSADPAGTVADAALAVGRLLERAGCPLRARRVVAAEERLDRDEGQCGVLRLVGAVERHEHLLVGPAESLETEQLTADRRDPAGHAEVQTLADESRADLRAPSPNDLVDLGISLEDTEDGQALVKLVPAAQLQAAKREKEAAAAEKAARKAQAAEQARLKRLENLEKGRVAPDQLFKTDDFSEWDERGLPTKDQQGAELAKKRRKNLEKDFDKQTKLHKEFLEAKQKGEIQ